MLIKRNKIRTNQSSISKTTEAVRVNEVNLTAYKEIRVNEVNEYPSLLDTQLGTLLYVGMGGHFDSGMKSGSSCSYKNFLNFLSNFINYTYLGIVNR